MSEPAISLAGVAKTFRRGGRETRALDPIDLTIGAGEFVAIVGPSGCGKSTLLRLVAGLIPASTGVVTLHGHAVSRPQTDLGIVFQSPVLLEWRTVLDNVLLQLELRDIDPRPRRERALTLLASVGLAEFADRYPRELSGGMRQRAAIVRALIHDAPLVDGGRVSLGEQHGFHVAQQRVADEVFFPFVVAQLRDQSYFFA